MPPTADSLAMHRAWFRASVIGATHAFSPTLVLDWNFGFTRQRLGSTFDLVSANGLNDLKIPGTNNVGAPGDPSLYYGFRASSFLPEARRRVRLPQRTHYPWAMPNPPTPSCSAISNS